MRASARAAKLELPELRDELDGHDHSSGGEYQILLCGGDPNSWAPPDTDVDSMTCNATTTELEISATIHQSGTIAPTDYSGTLAFAVKDNLTIGEPTVTQLTATDVL